MAQSVELLLDEQSDAAIRRQWNLLAEAGLPTERRTGPSDSSNGGSHRPHVTLMAADALSDEAEAALPSLVADLDLAVLIGGLTLFGPRRGRVILVRQVVASRELLELQNRVATVCGADPQGQFGPGRWTPHVTLARRMGPDQLGAALTALDWTADRVVPARITGCRRWDGESRTAWLL